MPKIVPEYDQAKSREFEYRPEVDKPNRPMELVKTTTETMVSLPQRACMRKRTLVPRNKIKQKHFLIQVVERFPVFFSLSAIYEEVRADK
jgi:hypothetical protein